MHILIINGPNLNLLGHREPGIYGAQTFEDFLETLRQAYPDVQIDYFQSNHEGDIIDRIHLAGYGDEANLSLPSDAANGSNPSRPSLCDGIILNAGAYTHTKLYRSRPSRYTSLTSTRAKSSATTPSSHPLPTASS